MAGRQAAQGGTAVRRSRAAACLGVCLAMVLVLGGCLGAVPPVEQYLRVTADGAGCGGASPDAADVSAQPVAFVPLKALDNLDRPAVLVADGSVLTPSLRWYWEGSPQSVMTAVLTRMVNCQTGVAGVLEYRPRVAHQAVLTGTVTAFNVQRQGRLRFVAGIRLDVWTRDSKTLVASREFAAQADMAGETAAAVAQAASEAAAAVASEACTWLSPATGGALARAFAESGR